MLTEAVLGTGVPVDGVEPQTPADTAVLEVPVTLNPTDAVAEEVAAVAETVDVVDVVAEASRARPALHRPRRPLLHPRPIKYYAQTFEYYYTVDRYETMGYSMFLPPNFASFGTPCLSRLYLKW